MKTKWIILMFLAALCGTLTAQPPEAGSGMDSNDAGGLPPTEQWLERMRRHHPEEYEMMQRLRKDNPAAFRGELRRKIDEKRFNSIVRDFPPMNQAYQSLPPEKRASFIEKLYGRPFGPPPGGPDASRPAWHEGDDQARRQAEDEIQKLDAEIMALSQEYQKQTDPAHKQSIKGRLESKLREMADVMDRHRVERIGRMEKRLEELKQTLIERQNNREEIISSHLQRLTGEE